MKHFFRTINSPLARRVGIYVILASTLVSIFTSGFQIYTEYSREKNAVYDIFEQVQKTQLSNIASRVWVLDDNELNTALSSLLELSAVKYAAVFENGELLVSVGNDVDKNVVIRKFALLYNANNTVNNVGELVIKVSLEKVYQHVIDRAFLILSTNFIKTIIVAFFILFIFYKLVNRHLSDISAYLSSAEPASQNKKLSLTRKDKKHDELDLLVDTINDMQKSLRQQFDKINQQKQRLSLTLNSIGDAVISTDTKGNIFHMNPVAEKLTGYSNNEANGVSIKTVFPVFKADENSNTLDKVINMGETVSLSNGATLISKQGIEFHISDLATPIKDTNDNIVGMVLVFKDITDQYKLRKELAINEKKYKILTTVAPVGLFYTNVKGDCLYVNDMWSEITGISFSDAKGDGWVNAIFPLDRENVFSAWNDFVNKDIPFKLEYRFQDNNDIKWVLGQALAEEDDDGNIIGYVGTITDITERKTFEYALNRSQKMDALGKLTGGISHDYNNMLGVILGYSELLKAKLEDQPDLKGYVDEIYAAGNRGAKLTNKLLSFSRQRATDAEVVDLNQVLNSEKDMLQKTLTASINLNFDLEQDIWPIKTDTGDLENAIVNLCINASHAMEGKGDLSITTRNVSVNDSNYVSMTVKDTGCGISEDEQEKIFDPFYSTKGESGTGLGLSQIYGFISRTGGIIELESELGAGTSFILLFPSYHEKTKEVKPTDNDPAENQEGHEIILVVDDELPLLSLCSEILLNNGYKVITAENGKQALEILDKEHVDLLLSDVVMPHMSGYELAAIVKEKYPSIKIQMASGFTGEQDDQVKDEALHKNILHKPYRIASLLKRVRELLD